MANIRGGELIMSLEGMLLLLFRYLDSKDEFKNKFQIISINQSISLQHDGLKLS